MPRTSPRTGNFLLDSLPLGDFGRVAKRLAAAPIPYGETMVRAGDRLRHVLFPTSGMVSVVCDLSDGSAVEVGIIGREGVLGFDIAMGSDTLSTTAIGQQPGEGLQMGVSAFRDAMHEMPSLRMAVLRSALLYLRQVSQTAACNGRHRLDQRLARWLLLTSDHAGADEFPLTQEFAAMMLGARRAGVTVAAAALRASGLIHYRRGQVEILDRRGLQRTSCECYRTVKLQAQALLG